MRARSDRIEALDRERAPAGRMLAELRELVREAEALARAGLDGGGRTEDDMRSEAERGGGAVRSEAPGSGGRPLAPPAESSGGGGKE